MQLVLAAILAFTLGVTYGYSKGENTTELKSVINANKQMNQQITKNNIALARQESDKLVLSNKITQLQEQLKNEKNNLNKSNHINRQFVRLTSGDLLPSSSSAAKSQDSSISDTESVAAAGVVEYIIALKAHDESCVVEHNTLVDILY
jgi:hypothetical protein